MRQLRLISTVFVLLAAIAMTGSDRAFGQGDTAQMSGYVKDATDAVIPGAQVTITHEVTRIERRTTSNESGYFVVTNLPPGFYTVTAEAEGFKRFVKTQNKLDANISTQVDAILEIGAVTETVEVVASVAVIQSETATVGKLVDATQIQNTVLNGRNPLFLVSCLI
jgi:hypothetical protein